MNDEKDHGGVDAGVEEGWTGRKCPHCKGTGENPKDDPVRPCSKCGGTGDEYGPLSKPAPVAANASAVLQNDLAEMLRALGMSDAAQPKSPHEVFQSAIAEMKRQLTNASAEARPRHGSMSAQWTYDPEAEAYYFAPMQAAPGPYLKQRHIDAIIDIAADGTLAGVELIDNMPPPPTHPHASDCARETEDDEWATRLSGDETTKSDETGIRVEDNHRSRYGGAET